MAVCPRLIDVVVGIVATGVVANPGFAVDVRGIGMSGLIAEVTPLIALVVSVGGRGGLMTVANGRRSAGRRGMLCLSTVSVFVSVLGKCGDTEDQQCR